MKEELQKKINKVLEELKDHTKFIHLFSDKPEGTLTRLHETIRQISLLLKMDGLKDVAPPENGYETYRPAKKSDKNTISAVEFFHKTFEKCK
jgi:hypothetical protein